eukprot:gene16096-biopygen6728
MRAATVENAIHRCPECAQHRRAACRRTCGDSQPAPGSGDQREYREYRGYLGPSGGGVVPPAPAVSCPVTRRRAGTKMTLIDPASRSLEPCDPGGAAGPPRIPGSPESAVSPAPAGRCSYDALGAYLQRLESDLPKEVLARPERHEYRRRQNRASGGRRRPGSKVPGPGATGQRGAGGR